MSDISRVEQLLRNALGEDIYEVTPQSRVEELLQQLNELIDGMGTVNPTGSNQVHLGKADQASGVYIAGKHIIFNQDGSVTWE